MTKEGMRGFSRAPPAHQSDTNARLAAPCTRTPSGIRIALYIAYALIRRDDVNSLKGSRARNILACTFAAVLGCASSAAADDLTDFPAGLACAFALRIESSGGNRIERSFFDKSGNFVRFISAGTGSALTFTNLGTDAKISTKSNGAVTNVTPNPDGSQTWVTTGHNILILFPTDVPAGPSTTLYVGRVVFTVDTNFTFTLQGDSGRATDICAVLS